jgi:hypothetical protein
LHGNGNKFHDNSNESHKPLERLSEIVNGFALTWKSLGCDGVTLTLGVNRHAVMVGVMLTGARHFTSALSAPKRSLSCLSSPR